MFFITEKLQKTIRNFSLDSLIVTEYKNGTSKKLNLLNEANDSKYVTRKQNIVDDNSNIHYGVRNNITYIREVLESNLRNYNDAYALVRGNITITEHQVTEVTFKNCAPFTKCITKIDGTIGDAEDLDLVMLMYNLIEYISNYSETTGSLWFY